jgi:hypothetical protein
MALPKMKTRSSGQRRRSAAYSRGFDDGVSSVAKSSGVTVTGIAREAFGVKIAFVVDCLRNYAGIVRDGHIDPAGQYFPSDIDEAADMLEAGDTELLEAARALTSALAQTPEHSQAMARLRAAVENAQ